MHAGHYAATTALCDGPEPIAVLCAPPARPSEDGSHQATVREAASQEIEERLEEVGHEEAGWESRVDKALRAWRYRNPGSFSAGWWSREHRHLRRRREGDKEYNELLELHLKALLPLLQCMVCLRFLDPSEFSVGRKPPRKLASQA